VESYAYSQTESFLGSLQKRKEGNTEVKQINMKVLSV
jgi:hypothetical protein